MKYIEHSPTNQSSTEISDYKDQYSKDALHRCNLKGEPYIIFSSDTTHTEDTKDENLHVYQFNIRTGNREGEELPKNSQLRNAVLNERRKNIVNKTKDEQRRK